MIIVYINDRLGTKAGIPCLASDPVSEFTIFQTHRGIPQRALDRVLTNLLFFFVEAFKAMVAARIGRQPHEIMLKRQGERPFKDQLTLEDYGVSNGVQLDLELDTGD